MRNKYLTGLVPYLIVVLFILTGLLLLDRGKQAVDVLACTWHQDATTTTSEDCDEP